MVPSEVLAVSKRRSMTANLNYKDEELGYNTQSLVPYSGNKDWYLIYNNVSYGKDTGFGVYQKVMSGEYPKDSTMIAKPELVEEYKKDSKKKGVKKWLLTFSVLIPLMVLLGLLLTR